MKPAEQCYEQFVNWVHEDIKKDRTMVNRKVFGVVFWCLLLPAIVSLLLYALKKFQWVTSMGYADVIVFLPPFAYALYSLWPTIRDVPRVFKKGGFSALLDESLKEVQWTESTANRLKAELKLTEKEWQVMGFHLRSDLGRMSQQNRYMSILASVVLFFMFQFLDLGGGGEIVVVDSSASLVKAWVDQFSQWSVQVFSLVLFSALFYLSGLQFQRHLSRYLVCIERIQQDGNE